MSIEKKYSEEEIRSIVDEAKAKLGMNRELSTDELESVSGGVGPEDALRHEYPLPKTHEEIDQRWDAVQIAKEKYGDEVALFMAVKMNLYNGDDAKFAQYGTGYYRRIMHERLDGKISGADLYSHH